MAEIEPEVVAALAEPCAHRERWLRGVPVCAKCIGMRLFPPLIPGRCVGLPPLEVRQAIERELEALEAEIDRS